MAGLSMGRRWAVNFLLHKPPCNKAHWRDRMLARWKVLCNWSQPNVPRNLWGTHWR